jgi:diacylglycerol kinase family enzyme
MAGIGVIHNPHSRKNRKHPERMHHLTHILGANGRSVKTQSIDDIHRIAREFKEQEIEILAINGGDGSNHVTLTAFIEEYQDTPLPKITFLRGGTMNTICNGLGIKGTQAGLLMNLARKCKEGLPFKIVQTDTINVAGRYGFIFGNGLIHNFLAKYYQDPDPSPWVAFKLVNRGILSSLINGQFAAELYKPFKAQVIVDGQVWPQESFTATAAATVMQIGLGFKPFFRCNQQPGSFHFLGIITKPSRFVMSLPKIYLGKKVAEKKVVETVAKEVVFESEESLEYTLDGDTHQTGRRLVLKAGPRLEIIIC